MEEKTSAHGLAALGEEPTVLLVAAGERLAPALTARLAEHHVQVELASPETAAQTAFVTAPDVIVLAGRAALEGGADVLALLGEHSVTSTLPVILVSDEAGVGRYETFRHGVVAVIDRTASADEMARRIAELAHELPERRGEASGDLAETSVDELVALFAQSLRSGILSVRGEAGAPSAQVVLRPDRPVTEAIAELVERLKPMIAGSDAPLQYEFHESPAARISSIDLSDDEDASLAGLRGTRLLVIQQNAARSDLLAQELRAAGATVAVADGSGAGLELAHDLAPEVIVVDGAGVESWALDALRSIRRDPRLRWASLLVMDSDTLWKDARRPHIALLAGKVDSLLKPDRELEERVRESPAVGTRLDVIGPIRMLRALCATELGLHVQIVHPRLNGHVDLADGLLAGATVRLPGSMKTAAEGPAALSSILGLSSGRVQITRAEAPKSASIMAPLESALAAAQSEKPVVAPSMPPPSIAPHARVAVPGPGKIPRPIVPKPAPSITAAPASAVTIPIPATSSPSGRSIAPSVPTELGGGDLPGLVGRLEKLLEDLREVEATELDGTPPAEMSTKAIAPPAAAPAIGARARPRDELPRVDSAFDEHTGSYSPSMVDQLRRRMRRSSSKIHAVKEQTELTEGAAKPAPPPPPPRPIPPAPKKPAAFATGAALPKKPTSRTQTFGAVSPKAPSDAIAAPKKGPTSKTQTFGAVSGAAEPPSGAIPPPPKAALGGPPTKRRARRNPTLVFGSAVTAPEAGEPPDHDLDASRPPKIDRGMEEAAEAAREAEAQPAEAQPAEAHGAEAHGAEAHGVEEAQESGADETGSDAEDAEAEPREPTSDERPIEGLEAPSELDVELGGEAELPTSSSTMSAEDIAALLAHSEAIERVEAIANLATVPPGAPPATGPAAAPGASPLVESPFEPDVFDAAMGVDAAELEALPAKRGLRWGLAVAIVVVLAATATGVAFLVLRPDIPPPVPTRTLPVADLEDMAGPADTGETDTGESATGYTGETGTGETGTGETVAETATPRAIGSDDPIEGRPEDFDLERLGIRPAEPPTSRRVLTRRVQSFLRDANRQRNRGDKVRAEALYNRVLALDPGNPRATAGLARVYLDRHEGDLAVLYAQRLARLRPEYASNYLLLGDCFLERGDRAAARRAFERALELEPGYRSALDRLAALR
jgi:CheY-like chemotaxis protein